MAVRIIWNLHNYEKSDEGRWCKLLNDLSRGCHLWNIPGTTPIDGDRFMTNNAISLLSNLVKSLVAQFGNIVVFYKVISFGLSIY